jgi:hypothetical protein
MAMIKVDSFDGEKGYVNSIDDEPMYAVKLDGIVYLLPRELELLQADVMASESQGAPSDCREDLRTGSYRAFRIVSVSPTENGAVAAEVRDPDVLQRLIQEYPSRPSPARLSKLAQEWDDSMVA